MTFVHHQINLIQASEKTKYKPHLNVHQVPGDRAQHLNLSAFNVKAEVVDFGVVQGQQQAETCQVFFYLKQCFEAQ